MAVELPFQEVERLSKFLALQRQQVQLGRFDTVPPKQRRAAMLAILTGCEAALAVTKEHMHVLDRIVKQTEAAADAAEAIHAAENEVPLL